MALSEEEYFTTEDIYALPDGIRAELIDGQIFYMAPPGKTHQKILSYLHGLIFNYIQNHNGSCEIYPAPFAVFLNKDDGNYVEPDISVICDKDKLDEKGCHGAPDWVIEIVSPSSKRMDYYTKLFKYRSSGVREYWIVDSKLDRIMVWNFEYNRIAEYSFADSVKSGIYEDLCIDFGEIRF